MRQSYACYLFSDVEIRGSHHYIHYMIDTALTHHILAHDALQYVWKKNPKEARATYLRYMRGCLYNEIAQELQVSLGRARQLANSGLSKMRKHLNRKYGKSIDLAA